jgi:hypothetical protein
MECSEWRREIGKGRKGQGNGIRPVAMSRRERFRVCSCLGSFCLSEELAEQLVVELVAASP